MEKVVPSEHEDTGDLEDHVNSDAPAIIETSLLTRNGNENVVRYTRTALVQLRNEQKSRKRPKCALRTELQAFSIWTCRLRGELQRLGVWKVSTMDLQCDGSCKKNICGTIVDIGNVTCNAGGINGDGNQYSSGGVLQSYIPDASLGPLANKRTLRCGRFINHQRRVNEMNAVMSSATTQSITAKFHIDHRSMSSSHLMPAFAKKHMGSIYPAAASSANGLADGLPVSSGEYGCEIGGEEGVESHTNREGRIRGKDHEKFIGNNYRRYIDENYLYKSNSGNRLNKEADNSNTETHPYWLPLMSDSHAEINPTCNKSNNAKRLDRRIGSGRLVSREVCWDYRSNSGGTRVEREKNFHGNFTSVESAPDNSNDKSPRAVLRFPDARNCERNLGERRPYDRRVLESYARSEKHENKDSGYNTRRYNATNCEDNSTDLNANHRFQLSQSCMIQRTMSFRRSQNHTSDKKEKPKLKEKDKDEPEWFSGGPTSQHDTIELRGFEEIDEQEDSYFVNENDEKHSDSSSSSPSSNQKLENANDHKTIILNNVEKDFHAENGIDHGDDDEGTSINNNSDTNGQGDNHNNELKDEKIGKHLSSDHLAEVKDATSQISPSSKSGNVDDILNFFDMDSLEYPIIAGDQNIISNEIGTSRFSRWFVNKESNKDDDFIPVVSQSKSYGDDKEKELKGNGTDSLMAFFRNNHFLTPDLPKTLPHAVLALSVEELEARMRLLDTKSEHTEIPGCGAKSIRNSGSTSNRCVDHPDLSPSPKTNQDVEAFKRLLNQLGAGDNKPRDVGLTINVMMDSHPDRLFGSPATALQEALNMQKQGILTHSIPVPLSNMVRHEDLAKPMQEQHQTIYQQKFLQMLPSTIQQSDQSQYQHMSSPISPQHFENENFSALSVQPPQCMLPFILGHHPLKQMEMQNLLQSFLERELKNPNASPYIKDVITSILNESSRSVTPSLSNQQNLMSIQTSPVTSCCELSPLRANGSANSNPINTHPFVHPSGIVEVNLSYNDRDFRRLHSPSNGSEVVSKVLNENSRSGTPAVGGNVNLMAITATMFNETQAVSTAPDSSNKMHSNCLEQSKDQQKQLVPQRSQQQESSAHLFIPSQRELQIHTQTILQNALKKKLEEQQQEVVLRRRQETRKHHLDFDLLQQQGSIPGNSTANSELMKSHHLHNPQPSSRHINSPTPLAFTPTSVLRKMTADKDVSFQQNASSQTSPQHNQQQQQHYHLQHMQQQHSQTQQSGNPSCDMFPLQQQHIQHQIQHQHPQTSQPRMILGGGSVHQESQQHHHLISSKPAQQVSPLKSQQQPQQISPQHHRHQPGQLRSQPLLKWPSPTINSNIVTVNKPIGRPILKGPMTTLQMPQVQHLTPTSQTQPHPPVGQNQQKQSTQHQQQQILPHITHPTKLELQQLQQHQSKGNHTSTQHMQLVINQSFPPPHTFPQSLANSQNINSMVQLHQQQHQQQHIYQQRSLSVQKLLQQQNQKHMQQHEVVSGHPNLSGSHLAAANNAMAPNLNYQRDGCLSPTSNQLAQWFSPELLAQASAGKLPLLNLNQALSLEEFERSIQHSSTVVHN
uniref:Protein cup n=1 Tax=Glossina pallidipes TaxID=7398 RepID=A0A1B0ACI9_GLOPL